MWMRPISTDVVVWSVCLSVMIMRPAKTAEPIEVLLELWTRVGFRNRVRWCPHPTMHKGNFEGESGGPL